MEKGVNDLECQECGGKMLVLVAFHVVALCEFIRGRHDAPQWFLVVLRVWSLGSTSLLVMDRYSQLTWT